MSRFSKVLWANRAEIVVGAGLLLVAVGLWDVSRAAALVVPGSVLLWLALPPRPPFIGGK